MNGLMGDPLIPKLIETVNAEIRFFHCLLELLEEERGIILNGDLEQLEVNIAAQHEAIEKVHRLEQERTQVIQELATRLNSDSGNLTLVRLIEILESYQSEELARMRKTLLELNQKIRTTHENNAFLIRQSLCYTKRCPGILPPQPVNGGTPSIRLTLKGKGLR